LSLRIFNRDGTILLQYFQYFEDTIATKLIRNFQTNAEKS